MAYYFCDCMGCDCKSLHYRMNNGYCQDCEHALSYHRSYFNKHISNPIQRDGCGDEVKQAMFTLEHEILDKCVLRRTKKTRADDMGLPPRLVTIRYVKLHPVEGK
jgi:DNA repair protein RAD16